MRQDSWKDVRRGIILSRHFTSFIECNMAPTAFDRVNWDFMTEVLRGVGLGDRMMEWLMALYRDTRVRVKANSTLSKYFNIQSGIRQGCPLSPWIFAMILEPFLCKIRRNGEISGACIGSVKHKVSTYADDLFFYLSVPQPSLTALVRSG